MSIRFEIDTPSLVNNRKLIAWYRLFAAECLATAQALTAARIVSSSGKYERSFTFELLPGSPPKLMFGNSAPFAVYVEEDTVAHDIVPRNKKALRWFDPPGGGEGAAVFSQKVRHPGTTGKHIVRDAIKEAGENLKRGSHRANFVD